MNRPSTPSSSSPPPPAPGASEGTESAPDRRADVEARIALLHLSGMGPSRIRWLLTRHDPIEVVERMRAGRVPASVEEAPPGLTASHLSRWLDEVRQLDPAALYDAQWELGRFLVHPDDAVWPFSDEHEPPLLLFCSGDVGLLGRHPAVSVVGTRRCTSVGRSVAHGLGLELGEAGVAVISGLALGIDAAAHQGALDAGGSVIGVVGTGLDVVYPTRNRAVWHEVERNGLLVSEYPAGAKPQRWRFPARNRLIASLADAVVIVESHARGGSLITADEASDRGKPVLAVPGSVLNPAADGANGLIVDGALPIRDATDVLVALGWSAPSASAQDRPDESAGSTRTATTAGEVDQAELPWAGNGDADGRPAAGEGDGDERFEAGESAAPAVDVRATVHREVSSGSVSIDHLAVLTGHDLVTIMSVLAAMEEAGEVAIEGSSVIWRASDGEEV